jgi:uncharacterized DUF497 family protein
MPGFEWDPEKERKNLAKHKVDFRTASRIWDGAVLERNDSRRDYGESRVGALGKVENRLMVVIFTWRGTVRRIISARKANPGEQRRFEAQARATRRNEK